MIFQFIALLILILFYSVYLGKMLLQRRQGIRTDQIARGEKDRKLFLTELVLKIATYSIIVVQIISIFPDNITTFTILRMMGAILGISGVIIFGIAVYTMGNSWRAGIPETDKTTLVINGIFHFSRNPAFLAFDMVYLCILLMFFNWVLFIFTIWAMLMLHLQILREEKFLQTTFGNEYTEYQRMTRRYIGRCSIKIREK